MALVKPLLKKLVLELLLSNYQPVSILTFLSKVLEKYALNQLKAHSEAYGLMPTYQSAYRPNFSCKTTLLKLTNDLLWTMEHQRVSALVAINLRAAFDTVDHDILLNVLGNKFGSK